MRALVTGATGFVGPHLVAHLRASGDELVGLDDDPVEICDPTAVTTWFDAHRPEVTYHLAGWADVGGSWAAPLDAFRVNAEGTLNVLEAALAVGCRRVLVVSSADVYGIVAEEDLPITEDRPLRPVSPYAVSKVAADYLGMQAWLGRHLQVVRARAFNHLGPGQSDRFVASAIASRIAANELSGDDEVPVGNLVARRDVTDVRDVVRAYRLLVEGGEAGEAYNVCSGVDVAIATIAEQLLAMASSPMHLVVDDDRHRPVDVPVLRGDPTKLARATGWAPAIPLERTLRDVLEDWRAKVRGGGTN
jgi:GDP-4-dehydro-6-deoxy-D-mannose reductase